MWGGSGSASAGLSAPCLFWFPLWAAALVALSHWRGLHVCRVLQWEEGGKPRPEVTPHV